MYSLAAASGLCLFSFFPQAESLEDKNMAQVQRCQLEKLKSQYDRLTEELTQNANENKKLKLKYQCLKDELEEKVNMWAPFLSTSTCEGISLISFSTSSPVFFLEFSSNHFPSVTSVKIIAADS